MKLNVLKFFENVDLSGFHSRFSCKAANFPENVTATTAG